MSENVSTDEFNEAKAAFEKAAKQSQPQLAMAHLVTVIQGLEESIATIQAQLNEALAAAPAPAKRTTKVADAEA